MSFSQSCIENLDGISLERIQYHKILVKQNGKNIAIVSTTTTSYILNPVIPEQIKQFRFFSQRLCAFGAESKFLINGELYEVGAIELFK